MEGEKEKDEWKVSNDLVQHCRGKGKEEKRKVKGKESEGKEGKIIITATDGFKRFFGIF